MWPAGAAYVWPSMANLINCEAIAKLVICINTSFVDPGGLTSFVACRLIG